MQIIVNMSFIAALYTNAQRIRQGLLSANKNPFLVSSYNQYTVRQYTVRKRSDNTKHWLAILGPQSAPQLSIGSRFSQWPVQF